MLSLRQVALQATAQAAPGANLVLEQEAVVSVSCVSCVSALFSSQCSVPVAFSLDLAVLAVLEIDQAAELSCKHQHRLARIMQSTTALFYIISRVCLFNQRQLCFASIRVSVSFPGPSGGGLRESSDRFAIRCERHLWLPSRADFAAVCFHGMPMAFASLPSARLISQRLCT